MGFSGADMPGVSLIKYNLMRLTDNVVTKWLDERVEGIMGRLNPPCSHRARRVKTPARWRVTSTNASEWVTRDGISFYSSHNEHTLTHTLTDVAFSAINADWNIHFLTRGAIVISISNSAAHTPSYRISRRPNLEILLHAIIHIHTAA